MSQENVEIMRAAIEAFNRRDGASFDGVLADHAEIVPVGGLGGDGFHQWRAKAQHTGIEFDAPLAYLWTFREGKVIHFQSFLDPKQALEAVGRPE